MKTSASAVLVAQAENGLLPELDLIGSIGYAGLVNGVGAKDFLLPVVRNIPGVNAHIGLSLQWPVSAIQAQGLLHRATAVLRDNEVVQKDLARRIGLNVGSSAATLSTAIRSFVKARIAAAHYKEAVDNERTKLKSGLSTIIDVILTEDRMTSARLNEIAEQARYAESVARLRFEAGMITEAEGDGARVDEAHLSAIPAVESM
jgi:outer membrane protein TolC